MNVIQRGDGLGHYRAATGTSKAHQAFGFLSGRGLDHTCIPMVAQCSGFAGDVAVAAAAGVGGKAFGDTSRRCDQGSITVDMLQLRNGLELCVAATGAGKAHQTLGFFGGGGLHHTFVPAVGQGSSFVGGVAVTAATSVGSKAFCGAGRLGNDGSILVNVIQRGDGLGLFFTTTGAGEVH